MEKARQIQALQALISTVTPLGLVMIFAQSVELDSSEGCGEAAKGLG